MILDLLVKSREIGMAGGLNRPLQPLHYPDREDWQSRTSAEIGKASAEEGKTQEFS